MMVCQTYGNVIVCGGWRVMRAEFGKCYGACGIEDAPIVMGESSGLYGPDFRCTVCGDTWTCEGLDERPFVRGWRQESISRSVAMWEAACMCPVEREAEDPVYPIACEHDRVRLGWTEADS